MGCDIHIHAEVQLEEGGDWHHYGHYSANRAYSIFSLVADCGRGPGPEPKGLPRDITAVTRAELEMWGDDYHSYTWLDSEEILDLETKLLCRGHKYGVLERWLAYQIHKDTAVGAYLFGNGWASCVKYPEEARIHHDVRWIIWFDC